MRTAKKITLYLKEPLPADLFKDLKELARRERPTIEVVVEDFRDSGYLQSLHGGGFSLFYGLGLPSQTVVFLEHKRGFLFEDDQQRSGRGLRLLKNATDLYFSLLWRRFGHAVLLSGLVKEVDIKSSLFCLAVEGKREYWCRFKEDSPRVGTTIQLFGWEKWNSRILDVLDVRVLETVR